MSSMVIEIPPLSDQALEIMMRVIDENEKTQKIQDETSGPLALASALSDFFQLASALENGDQQPEVEVISELATYALDLFDRLASQLWYLDIHDQRDRLSRVVAALAVWFARRDAILDNLQGTADGFAIIVNGETDTRELATLSLLMDEVLDAASDTLKMDEDRSDAFRPWRVLNLNTGIAATRSLDPQLMQATFEKLGHRLPNDMPGFFADGKRNMIGQNIPQEVEDIMNQFADRWPGNLPH